MKKWQKIILIVLGVILFGSISFAGYRFYNSEANEPEEVFNPEEGIQPPIITYAIVDTNQDKCYDNTKEITCPKTGAFARQDGNEAGNTPSYTDNKDGTITDNVTNLMWQQDPGNKVTHTQAVENADDFTLASHADWRLPTAKELYSLIQFNGTDIDPQAKNTSQATPFLNNNYFNFSYGDPADGDRVIDSQWATSTVYESTTMNNEECFFGVNFADGRIKCYPTDKSGKKYYVIYVRDNTDYGLNSFASNADGTITDNATGLTWQESDSAKGLNWQNSLNYCSTLKLGNYTDWRLPNAKELQSIVDYSRSPDLDNAAAIDAIFKTTSIKNEKNQTDWPSYWSSTTHLRYNSPASEGVYVAFGRAMGKMQGAWMDVHGAGAQRSDPKSGDPADFDYSRGPQGDAVRILNYARCVR